MNTSDCKTTRPRHRKTYAERVAARKARRTQPKHSRTIKARARNNELRAAVIRHERAGDVPAGKVN